MSTDLTIPRDIADRVIALGERDAAAIEGLGDKLDTFMLSIAPVIEQHGIEMKARAAARAKVEADILEDRGNGAKLRSWWLRAATHPLAFSLYGVIVTAILTYLAALAGIAPAEVRAALTEEATHAAAPR